MFPITLYWEQVIKHLIIFVSVTLAHFGIISNQNWIKWTWLLQLLIISSQGHNTGITRSQNSLNSECKFFHIERRNTTSNKSIKFMGLCAVWINSFEPCLCRSQSDPVCVIRVENTTCPNTEPPLFLLDLICAFGLCRICIWVET